MLLQLLITTDIDFFTYPQIAAENMIKYSSIFIHLYFIIPELLEVDSLSRLSLTDACSAADMQHATSGTPPSFSALGWIWRIKSGKDSYCST